MYSDDSSAKETVKTVLAGVGFGFIVLLVFLKMSPSAAAGASRMLLNQPAQSEFIKAYLSAGATFVK